MKPYLINILFLLTLFFVSRPAPGICQSAVPADSLSYTDTGAIRPIDLVPEQAFWNKASPDLFTYWVDSGLYGYYGPQPEILLDSIPVDINFFGWQNLNMLPIHLPEIIKTVTVSGGQSYQSTYAEAGAIDFISHKPDSGLSVSTSVYWGNETGDPGPWIYDSTRVTPNVDRWGPDLTGNISYRFDKWYAKSILSLRNHQQTDPISHRRLHNTMRALGTTGFNPIQTTSRSGLWESGYLSETWNLKVRGIQSKDENYLFLQPFGREVPSRSEYTQLAGNVNYSADLWSFNMRYIREMQKLGRRNEEHNYVFNWKEQGNTYFGSVSYQSNSLQLYGGFEREEKEISVPGLTEETYSVNTLFANAKIKPGKEFQIKLESGFSFSNGAAARNFRSGFELQPLGGWDVEVIGNYNEVLPIRQQTITYWITKGYTFFDELGIDYGTVLTVTRNRLWDIHFKNSIRPTSKLIINLSIRFIHHLELNIPWQEVSFSSQFDTEPERFINSGESGSRILLYGSLTHTPRNWMTQKLGLHMSQTPGGSDRYRTYFRQIPRRKVTYQLKLTPVQNLDFSLEGRYQSSAHWEEFEALDGQQYEDIDNLFPVYTGTFQSTVASHFNIDVSARKWLWNKKLNLQFTVQNLLNDEVRMHPMGADRSLLFNIKAEARF